MVVLNLLIFVLIGYYFILYPKRSGMNIQEKKYQEPLNSVTLPMMNVQQETQKGLSKPNAAMTTDSQNKTMGAASVIASQLTQNPQQVASKQLPKGYLDIKV